LIPNGAGFSCPLRPILLRPDGGELIVDDWDLVVRLTLGEKILGVFHGDIRVRLPSIVSVAARSQAVAGPARMADGGGQLFPGTLRWAPAGTGDGYDFLRPAPRLAGGPGGPEAGDVFSRLVIGVPEGGDPQAEAARIGGRGRGSPPSAPAS